MKSWEFHRAVARTKMRTSARRAAYWVLVGGWTVRKAMAFVGWHNPNAVQTAVRRIREVHYALCTGVKYAPDPEHVKKLLRRRQSRRHAGLEFPERHR